MNTTREEGHHWENTNMELRDPKTGQVISGNSIEALYTTAMIFGVDFYQMEVKEGDTWRKLTLLEKIRIKKRIKEAIRERSKG